ncbi:MAG: helix-turn-helix transcriptional regulator [Anaerolineae bacterium]|nr:ArsR family transcriptional regulator [Ardenticatenia bacterium]MBK8539299.1 ArsR family transcriptional regulator [Ardenticatenia bacterium]HQZ71280.1 ArsR family transcriptional regulator [Anaerolineae bacterium]HRA19300.1 ArsR family transcriptional regulator [Anaerolineae bacterium]
MQDTRNQLLCHLKAHGSTTVAELAVTVRLEPVTVRHHLGLLRDQGLVESDTQRHGRGRPRNIYRLSPSGRATLREDGCERLAGRLLDWVLAHDGREAELFFAASAREAIAAHGGADGALDMEGRLESTVALLVQEGFEACWDHDAQGYLIRHTSCPYSTLCLTHPAVCCLDQTLIEALHPGAVSRESWRPAGDDVCTYRISPSPERPAPPPEAR